MLENLIGAQILSVSDDCIEVRKDGESFMLEIISDDGGCCGYADFVTKLLYSKDDFRNPIITNISFDEKEDVGDGDSSIVTFYGESKPLATINSEAGSGSGWGYGAHVSLRCKALDINEDLASW